MATWLAIPAAGAADCRRADYLYQQSLYAGDGYEAALLAEAVRLCPTHAGALNNLGLVKERRGDLDAAERLYRAAIATGDGAPAPYAGVADVLMARGQYTRAAEAYGRYLDRLESARRLGLFPEFHGAAADYRARRDLAREKAGLPPVVVSAQAITRALTPRGSPGAHPGVRNRSFSLEYAVNAAIDLPIRFDFDSATVQGQSLDQVVEVAEALNGSALRGSRILIEGHTDSVGGRAYNQGLSERRAAAVRALLVVRFGLPARRLEIRGFGEDAPALPGDSEVARAANRRVTFRNLGR